MFLLSLEIKYPIMKNWPEEATTDLQTIKEWWTRYPDANIGMVTGERSGGVVVVDLDEHPEEGKYGLEIWRDFQQKNGYFPQTLESQTGSGGRHIFFRIDHNAKRMQHLYNSSVDFQADGALIVLPPSIHPNGYPYFWDDLEPDEIDIATFPPKLWDFIQEGAQKEVVPSSDGQLTGTIYEGCRVNTLFRLAMKLKSMGLSEDSIKSTLRRENEIRCIPPLTERELEKEVFPSLRRYEDGNSYFKSFQIPEIISGRQRESILYRAICSMRSKGWSREAIRKAVLAENEVKCVPPLTLEQLEKAVFPALDRFKAGGGLIERRRQIVRIEDISQI